MYYIPILSSTPTFSTIFSLTRSPYPFLTAHSILPPFLSLHPIIHTHYAQPASPSFLAKTLSPQSSSPAPFASLPIPPFTWYAWHISAEAAWSWLSCMELQWQLWGMLSTIAAGLAIDVYSPISGNADGIAEMA